MDEETTAHTPDEIEKFCTFLQRTNQAIKQSASKFYALASPNLWPEDASNLTAEFDSEFKLFNATPDKNLFEACLKLNELTTEQTQRNQAKYVMTTYAYPFILIFGILGNIVSCLAMVKKYKSEKKSQRKNVHTFAFCLAILCFADLNILLLGCLTEYIEQVFDYSVRQSSVFACKFLYFTCYLFSSFVSYLYAFIAKDRWQAATKPIKHMQTRTGHNQKQIAAIFAFCFVICFPFCYYPTLFEVDSLEHERPATKCQLPEHLFHNLTLLDAVLYSFLPFVCTLVFSSLTLIALIKERRFLNRNSKCQRALYSSHVTLNTVRTSQSLPTQSQLIHDTSLFSPDAANLPTGPTFKIASTNKTRVSRLKLTLSLMTFPISYLISTLPVFLIILLQLFAPYVKRSLDFEEEFAVASTLMYANNSFNILFFILFGKRMRKDLFDLFRLKPKAKLVHTPSGNHFFIKTSVYTRESLKS